MSDKKIMFYHATETNMVGVLFELLKKTFLSHKKCLVCVDTFDNMTQISEKLWALNDDFILPHGLITQIMPDKQPILLTQTTDNLNGADYLFFIGQVTITDTPIFERYIVIFDDNDDDIKNYIRESYVALKKENKNVIYYKQQAGAWVQK
jgi:DNA polymerase III subunit chi